MRVRDVMTRGVEVVHPDTTLQEAAETMRERNVGLLLVCEGARLVGLLTDRDITVRSTAEGLDPWTDRVREAMTSGVLSCFEDQDVQEAASLMEEKQVRRLAVFDRGRQLVGVVSLADLTVRTGNSDVASKVLESTSQPEAADG